MHTAVKRANKASVCNILINSLLACYIVKLDVSYVTCFQLTPGVYQPLPRRRQRPVPHYENGNLCGSQTFNQHVRPQKLSLEHRAIKVKATKSDANNENCGENKVEEGSSRLDASFKYSTQLSEQILDCSNNKNTQNIDGKRKIDSLQHPDALPIIHFNNAGSSPQPLSVLQTVTQHTLLESLLGGYLAAEQCQHQLSCVYSSIAKFIHAEDSLEIALVESATVAWTRIFYSMCDALMMGENKSGETDVMLCSEAEYAANVVAMQKICNERDATLIVIPGENGVVNIDIFSQMLRGEWWYYERNGNNQDHREKKKLNPERIRLVCITHIPTNSGIINPVIEIGEIIDEFNKLHRANQKNPLYYLVDACQSVGQLDIDVTRMKCHALTATGRKYLRGPRGTGFLYVQKNIADKMIPSHVDHAAAPVIDVPTGEENINFGFKEGALRFEFWEANIATQLGLGRAIDYAMNKDIKWIEKQCCMMGEELKRQLRLLNNDQRERVYIHNDDLSGKFCQCGIVTFHVQNYNANFIKQKMLDHRFTLSVVPPTSTPFDSAKSGLGNRELMRASLSYFNTKEEITVFRNALVSIIDGE